MSRLMHKEFEDLEVVGGGLERLLGRWVGRCMGGWAAGWLRGWVAGESEDRWVSKDSWVNRVRMSRWLWGIGE